jgi:hypothetical protein
MQWPIEKGKNDKQWSKKKQHRKLKIEQHESHLKPGRNYELHVIEMNSQTI